MALLASEAKTAWSNPQRFWLLGRSPLRTILHLLPRAAGSPSLALPIELKDQPAPLRFAIACDPLMPAATLAELACDPNEFVRWQMAGNTPVLLEDLVCTNDPEQGAIFASAPLQSLVSHDSP